MNFKSWKTKAVMSLGILSLGFNHKAQAQCSYMKEPELTTTFGFETQIGDIDSPYEHKPHRITAGMQLELKGKFLTPIFAIKGALPFAGNAEGGVYNRGFTGEHIYPYSVEEKVLNYQGKEKATVTGEFYLGIGGNDWEHETPLSAGPVVGVRATFTDMKAIVAPYAGLRVNYKLGDQFQFFVTGTTGAEKSDITVQEYTGQHYASGVPIYQEKEAKSRPNINVSAGVVFKMYGL